MHVSILKLIKYDEFANSMLDSILLEQTEPSTFRLSSAYRYLINSWSFRLVSVQLKQAESWSFKLVSVLLKQAESWSFSLVSVCGNRRIIKFQRGFRGVSVAETPSFTAETAMNLGRSISSAASFCNWNYTESSRFRKVSVKIPISETAFFMQWVSLLSSSVMHKRSDSIHRSLHLKLYNSLPLKAKNDSVVSGN